VLEETNRACVFKPHTFVRLQEPAVEEIELGFPKNGTGDVLVKRSYEENE
jgi:hypothetical protein